ncbi:MAG: MGDG synthase family glycosyltransferase [Clostridia bacterium]|nr:UDP-N-acetylglucosamine 2-epimerase [Clostridium sp.]
MKILIFYASYGGGHLKAAESINECILNNYKDKNIEVELIDCMKYVNKAIEKMTTAAYREMAKKMPWAWGKIYNDSQKGPLAHISSRSNKIMAIKLLRLLREKQPDLIISTHPFGSQMCSYLKRKRKINAKIATILTDFAPHSQWLVGSDYTDYFFVAHDKMKSYLLSQNIEENKIFVTGIPLSNKFLCKYDRNDVLKNFELKDNKFNILFFGGGEFGLGKTRTVEIFEEFSKFAKSRDFQVIGIAGKNEKMKLAFENIVRENNCEENVKVLEFTNKVPELMSISDLVVTKPGGMTTTESLASELPMIIINPIPGQEVENAEFLESKNIAIWIRKDDDVNEVLKNLFESPTKLKEMKQNTKLLANINSTKNICDILLK